MFCPVLIIIKMDTAWFKYKVILLGENFVWFYGKTEKNPVLQGQSFGSFQLVSKSFNQSMAWD